MYPSIEISSREIPIGYTACRGLTVPINPNLRALVKDGAVRDLFCYLNRGTVGQCLCRKVLEAVTQLKYFN